MKVRVEVVCLNADGEEQRRQVLTIERRELAMETLGVILTEGKALLAGVQDFVVAQQSREELEQRRACPHCRRRYTTKDSGSTPVSTVFGRVEVPNPRWNRCACQTDGPRTFRPMRTWLNGQTSPEMLYLETKWASLIPFARAADLLKEVLPVGDLVNAQTVRNHLQLTAERIEQELLRRRSSTASMTLEHTSAIREFIPNFGERRRQGETISTAFVESTINQVVSRRFVKKQQMQWTLRGAHLLLQTRTRVLSEDLDDLFRRWYPNQVATTNAGARVQGGLTPDFLATFAPLANEVELIRKAAPPRRSPGREEEDSDQSRRRAEAGLWWQEAGQHVRDGQTRLWACKIGRCSQRRPSCRKRAYDSTCTFTQLFNGRTTNHITNS